MKLLDLTQFSSPNLKIFFHFIWCWSVIRCDRGRFFVHSPFIEKCIIQQNCRRNVRTYLISPGPPVKWQFKTRVHECSIKNILCIVRLYLWNRQQWSGITLFLPSIFISQPVAEVLAYLHMQISPISCNVVGSILHVHCALKNSDTAIVGYRWTGVGEHHALYC